MKKLRIFVLGCALSFGMSSCVVYQAHTVSGAPVGTKKGVAKGAKDHSIATAMKNGGITTVGSVDEKITYFIFPFYKTVVTGE